MKIGRILLHQLGNNGKAFPPDSKRFLQELVEFEETLPDFQRQLPTAEEHGISRDLLLAAIPWIEREIEIKERWIEENNLRALLQEERVEKTTQIQEGPKQETNKLVIKEEKHEDKKYVDLRKIPERSLKRLMIKLGEYLDILLDVLHLPEIKLPEINLPSISPPTALVAQPEFRIQGLQLPHLLSRKKDNCFGKIEGNKTIGFYMTDLLSIENEYGDLRTLPFEKKIVKLPDIKELGERQANEVDVEVPVLVLSHDFTIALPTPIDREVIGISFDNLDPNTTTIKKDIFGITYLTNLPIGLRTIKYRLREKEAKSIREVSSDWLHTFEIRNPRPENKFFEEAMRNTSNTTTKMERILQSMLIHLPIADDNSRLARLLVAGDNFFETEEALGHMGHCMYLSEDVVNKFRNYGIPALIAVGYTAKWNRGSAAFQIPGHAMVLFIHENGKYELFEATGIDGHSHVLEMTRRDLRRALATIYEQDGNTTTLEQMSSTWRKPNEVGKDHHDAKTELLKDAASLYLAKSNWARDLDNLFIFSKANSLRTKARNLAGQYTSRLDFFTIRVINSTDIEKYKEEFKQHLQSDPQKQFELIDAILEDHPMFTDNDPGCRKVAAWLFELLNIDMVLKLPDEKLQQLSRRLATDSLGINDDYRSWLLLEIAKQRKECDIRTVDYIRSNLTYAESFLKLSDTALENYCNCLKLSGEEHLENTLALGAPGYDEPALARLQKAGIGDEYIQNKDGKLILSEKIALKVARFFKELQLENYFWYSKHFESDDFGQILNGLKAIGVDLFKMVTPNDAARLLNDRITNPEIECFHTHPEHLDPQKPVSAALAIFNSDPEKRKKAILLSKNIAAYCNFFRISIPRKILTTQKRVWNKSLKEALAIKNKRTKIEIPPLALPREQLLELSKHFRAIKNDVIPMERYIELTGLTNIITMWEFVIDALYKKVPEAKEAVWHNLIECRNAPTLFAELIYHSLPKDSIYRLAILLDIVPAHGTDIINDSNKEQYQKRVDKIIESLVKPLLKAANVQTIPKRLSEIVEIYDNAGLGSGAATLMRLYGLVFLPELQWHEFESELDCLSPNECKLFSIMLLHEDIKSGCKETFQSRLTPSSNTHQVLSPLEFQWGAVHFANLGVHLIRDIIIKLYKPSLNKSFWHRQLATTLVWDTDNLKDRTKEEIEYFSEASEHYHLVTNFCERKLTGENTYHQSLLRKAFVPFNVSTGTSEIKCQTALGDFHDHREYTPGDDPRLIDQKASGRSDKIFVRKSEDMISDEPHHFILDLEYLKAINPYTGSLGNIGSLISILYSGLVRKKNQDLHIFYRGEKLISINNTRLREMMTKKEIEDDFGKRTNLVDFMLQLNYLAAKCEKLKEAEKNANDFSPAPYPLSRLEWIPDVEKGTAYVITDNPALLKKSAGLFKKWQEKGIDVKRIRMAA